MASFAFPSASRRQRFGSRRALPLPRALPAALTVALTVALMMAASVAASPDASLSAAPVSSWPGDGRALDPKTGNLLYLERHAPTFRNGALVAVHSEYRSPGGAILGHRTLGFGGSPWQPDYRLHDARDGYEEGARPEPNGVRVFVRASRDAPLREKILAVPSPFVVDGGFDGFLRDHRTLLRSGKTLSFNFVAPARLDYFAFEARRDAGGKDGDSLTILIRPANALLRVLVPPIRVTYEASSWRLVKYEGISNINDGNAKSFPVRILYPTVVP